jgi:hypothetical protein
MAMSKIPSILLLGVALAFGAAAAAPAQGSSRVSRHYDFFVSVHTYQRLGDLQFYIATDMHG